MNRRWMSITAAVLLALLALARGAGGVLMLLRGPAVVEARSVSAAQATWVGVGLLVVALFAAAASVALFLNASANARLIGYAALVAFVIGGAINGFVLFGSPRPAGLVGNLAFAIVTALLIAGSGKSRS